MGQLANIVVKDIESTPVEHTLIPDGASQNGANRLVEWKGSASGKPDDGQIHVSMGMQKLPSGIKKVTFEVAVPVLEVVSGSTPTGYVAPAKVAHVDRFVVTGFFHPRSTVASRQNARQILSDVVSGRLTANSSAAMETYGPTAELIDTLVLPN